VADGLAVGVVDESGIGLGVFVGLGLVVDSGIEVADGLGEAFPAEEFRLAVQPVVASAITVIKQRYCNFILLF